MQIYKGPGHVVAVPAPANLNSGDPFLVGAFFGFAETAALSGATVQQVRTGKFGPVVKATGAAWAIGDIIYWDNTAKNFTKTSAGNTRVGIAASVQASGDLIGDVVLGVETI